MTRTASFAIAAGCCLALASCAKEPAPCIQAPIGQLCDRGKSALMGRYTLNIGRLALDRAVTIEVAIDNLPPDRLFTLGVLAIGGDCAEVRDSRVGVDFLVKNERNDVVLAEQRILADLVWAESIRECAPSFGYVPGERVELPFDEQGNVCGTPIITGADQGRGTSFVTRKGAVYTVIVKTFGAADAAKRDETTVFAFLRDTGPVDKDWISECLELHRSHMTDKH